MYTCTCMCAVSTEHLYSVLKRLKLYAITNNSTYENNKF